MNKTQLFFVIGAVGLTIILFQLPKSVVENDQVQEMQRTENHTLKIPPEVEDQIAELRTLIRDEDNFDKKVNFAHSLAMHYLNYGVLDSAEKYAVAIETWFQARPSEQVANIYFTAFERARSPEESTKYAWKTRQILEKLLNKDSSNLYLKNRLAMTLVVSDHPMSGIALLKEILAKDETNRQAILNLGLLAIQSGQFKRAKERFEKLVSLNMEDYEAKLYLAVSMIEINQQSQARLLLEEILAVQDSIPVIKIMANDYLQML